MIQSAPGSGEVVAASLRLPRHIRDELKIQAFRSGRSFNTHAVMILAGSLPANGKDRQGGNPDGLE